MDKQVAGYIICVKVGEEIEGYSHDGPDVDGLALA